MTLLRGGRILDDAFTAEATNFALPSAVFQAFEDLSGSLGGVTAC